MRKYDVRAVLTKLGIAIEAEDKRRLWGLCPFHEDTRPSWFIRFDGRRRGQYFCFSCQEGGGLADLVSHVRGYASKSSAHEWLENFEQSAEGEPLVSTVSVQLVGEVFFRIPREVIREPFEDWISPARKYLQERDVTSEQVRRWNLGYAVEGRLRGRIVIPIEDQDGRWVNYHARSFTDSIKRYLYPREEDHPVQSVFFGERRWPPVALRKFWTVIVTEGVFNALSVERVIGFDFKAIAALGGVHIHPLHLGKLATFGKVVGLTDSDQAGDSAAETICYQMSRWSNFKRIRLPGGVDANEMTIQDLSRELGTAWSGANELLFERSSS